MQVRAAVAIVTLVFLVGALAGCVGNDASSATTRQGTKKFGNASIRVTDLADPILSQPIFPELLFENLPFTASDGTALDSWLYRPVTPPDVKVPTIVHVSPYFGTSLPAGGGGLDRGLRDNFTSRGYAVLMHSVRGTGFSGGCFEIGGPRERLDTIELFNYIAEQPWSNGNIGLIGVSYDGTAPQGALIAGSPHLKTIVPVAAISEWYKYNFIRGVQINPQGYAFNTYYVGDEGTPNFHGLPHEGPLSASPPDPTRPPTVDDATMWPEDAQVAASRLCPNQGSNNGMTRGGALIDTQRAQIATAFTGTTDPYWEERNFTRFLDKVRDNMSVFVVHGLIDYNVKTHNLMPWYPELKAHNITTKILLGQWPHAYPGTVRPNGPAAWNLTLLKWFDYWLKGIDTGILDEPEAMIQDFAGVWHYEDTFPPTRAVMKSFFFDGSGELKEAAGSGQSMFIDNGQAPNPALPNNPAATAFMGPVLEKEFRYSGEARAHLTLSHTAPRGQIAVTVYNVTGDTWTPINWGFYNYNIRNDPASFDPVVPNQRFTLVVPLLPTDMVVAPGSRIAVTFSGANSGGPGMLPPPSGGSTTVYHGDRSFIEFPMIDGITPICPQPEMLGRDSNGDICPEGITPAKFPSPTQGGQ